MEPKIQNFYYSMFLGPIIAAGVVGTGVYWWTTTEERKEIEEDVKNGDDRVVAEARARINFRLSMLKYLSGFAAFVTFSAGVGCNYYRSRRG